MRRRTRIRLRNRLAWLAGIFTGPIEAVWRGVMKRIAP